MSKNVENCKKVFQLFFAPKFSSGLKTIPYYCLSSLYTHHHNRTDKKWMWPENRQIKPKVWRAWETRGQPWAPRQYICGYSAIQMWILSSWDSIIIWCNANCLWRLQDSPNEGLILRLINLQSTQRGDSGSYKSKDFKKLSSSNIEILRISGSAVLISTLVVKVIMFISQSLYNGKWNICKHPQCTHIFSGY
jgi:hypothetical protein